jgi:hypothetical protein
MDAVTVALLELVLKMVTGLFQIINSAGTSADDTAAYKARIIAAMDAVPPPCVGKACDDGGCGTGDCNPK